MSKAKKVLGLFLAIALVFNVFAVLSFAVDAGKVAFSADSKSVLEAGKDVTVDFYLEVPAGQTQSGIFQILVAYDNTVLTPKSRTWNSYYDCFADAAAFTTDKSGWLKLTDDEKKIYNDACCVAVGSFVIGNTNGASGNVFNLKDTKAILFSVTFTVNSEFKGNSTSVAILNSSFANATRCYIKDTSAKKLAQDKVDCSAGAVTLKTASNPITFVKTQAQWADGNNVVQDEWKLGIVGKFKNSDIDIAFDPDTGRSTNVDAVGVEVTAGDYTVTETTKYVYETATGEYSFRAVVTGIPANVTAEKTITVTFFAKVGDETVTGETKTINLADALAQAQDNGMAS